MAEAAAMAPAEVLGRLLADRDHTADEVEAIVEAMMGEQWTSAQMAAWLVLMRAKGETTQEIAGAARAMRSRAMALPLPSGLRAVDTCGTGGDGKGWLNISTTAALVTAACGAPVVKHGNRAISSRAGSADVLAALGVNVQATPAQVAACVTGCGIGFAFAPAFHAATKVVAPVRRELGVRTLFNVLGPLTNPAGVPFQVVGVFAPEWVSRLAGALLELGIERAHVLCGHDGSDELAVDGPTHVCRVAEGRVELLELEPEMFGLASVSSSGLAGQDAGYNAQVIAELLQGGAEAAARWPAFFSAVAMTAALALHTVDHRRALRDCCADAQAAIIDGSSWRVVERLRELSFAP